MRGFLAAHRVGAAFGGVVEAGLLLDACAGFDDFDLALDLVVDSVADVAEAVDVFNFGLGTVLRRSLAHDRDVGVAAEGALFHVAVGDAGVEEDFLEAGEVLVGLVGGAEVGLGDDFDEGCAAAVEVDVGAGRRVGEAVVDGLAGVLFHVEAGNADATDTAAGGEVAGDVEVAVFCEGLVELGDLVALGRVGVEVVLAGKDAGGVDGAIDRGGGEGRELHRLAVEDGERTGQAETDGAGVGVGVAAVAVDAAAERLGIGEELDVDFKADDGLVLVSDLWWEHGRG